MTSAKDSPLFLLLSTGLLLGLYFPVGKYAAAAGIDPMLWALSISLGPGLLIGAFSFVSGGFRPPPSQYGFALVSGMFAYVIPNGIAFAALPHVGSGFMSLMYAFSPVVTAVISMLLRVRPPNGRLLAGVGFGFAGAVLITLSRQSLTIAGQDHWFWLAFLVPVSLGCGNVFRTAYWPEGMRPLHMAALTNLMAACPLVILLLLWGREGAVAQALQAPGLLLLQVVISGAMFIVFFRLQWVGGPTYLSQIGYVAAAVGLLMGVFLLGEHYPLLVWAGAAAIAAGVVVSNWPGTPRERRISDA